MNYRNTAKEHCSSAKALLKSGTDDDVLLATLKLRMAMECITYEQAEKYADELGPEDMQIWQPKKLLDKILEIDPQADSDSTLSVGLEPSPGETPESMQILGTEHVLSLKTLKEHYDALGSYLHTPILKKINQGKTHDYSKLSGRCNQIIDAIETVLSSKVWNTGLAIFGELKCLECDALIMRRLPKNGTERKVYCWSCPASYSMSEEPGNKVNFEPCTLRFDCNSDECSESVLLWEKQIVPGTYWTCSGCQSKYEVRIGIMTTKPDLEDKETD